MQLTPRPPPRSLKSGKVVICLQGRMAGKKGVIVKTFDDGTDGRRYGHAIVAGIARAPLKVKKGMSEKKVEKRSRVKPFLKLVNFNHLMPTRCAPLPQDPALDNSHLDEDLNSQQSGLGLFSCCLFGRAASCPRFHWSYSVPLVPSHAA